MRRTHRLKQVRARVDGRKAVEVDYSQLDWDDLRAVAKAEGINTFSMTREEIEAALVGGDEE